MQNPSCEMSDCTRSGAWKHTDADGDELYLCEEHFNDLRAWFPARALLYVRVAAGKQATKNDMSEHG